MENQGIANGADLTSTFTVVASSSDRNNTVTQVGQVPKSAWNSDTENTSQCGLRLQLSSMLAFDYSSEYSSDSSSNQVIHMIA